MSPLAAPQRAAEPLRCRWWLTAEASVQEIKKHPNAHMQYVDKLLAEGSVTEDEVRDVHNRVQTILQEEFDAAKDYRPTEDEWLSNVWEGFKSPAQLSRIRNTGAPRAARAACMSPRHSSQPGGRPCWVPHERLRGLLLK